MTKERTFGGYEIFIIAILAILQFTIILDFMVLSPLSPILLNKLHITTAQFSLCVSAYAFSAGISGLCAAGFADKFDRKKLLLFFYAGFILGTFLCGIAPNYHFLLAARIVTGLFGGVIGSISFAIITDLFAFQVRGRVMGFVQMAFSSSQVLGIPLGLYLANTMGWHAPFILIASLSIIVFIAIAMRLKPIVAHLHLKQDKSPLQHILHIVQRKRYLTGFAAITLLATGGFMLMPFAAAFNVHNVGIDIKKIPFIYAVTGVCSMIAGPIVGRFSDKLGKYNLFVAGSILSMILVLIYTNLGVTPLWMIIVLNAVMFIGITSRIISASALASAIPDPADRGAYMSVQASVQQISGGIAAFAAGLIVSQTSDGYLEHYPVSDMW